MLTEQKWNFQVIFNRLCCHGNYVNVKFYLSIKIFHQLFFTCQVSACEPQPFSCHDLANDIYSQTVKPVFSHLYAEDVCGQYKVNYPQKTADISRCHYWFTHKMTSEKRAQEIPYWWPVTTQILVTASDWLKQIFNQSGSNQFRVITRHQYGISVLVALAKRLVFSG